MTSDPGSVQTSGLETVVQNITQTNRRRKEETINDFKSFSLQ